MLNSIKEQDDIDKIYLYTKNLSERKYEFLIQNREDVGIKYLNDPNAFIECAKLWIVFMKMLMITTQAEKGKF